VDGIYPPWSCFVQTIHSLEDEKRAYYNKMHESTRGGVEHPSKLWSLAIMANIIYAYIIMYNMIIEDEGSEHNLKPLFEVEATTDFTRALPFEALIVGT
jgi:hypothetical protein